MIEPNIIWKIFKIKLSKLTIWILIILNIVILIVTFYFFSSVVWPYNGCFIYECSTKQIYETIILWIILLLILGLKFLSYYFSKVNKITPKMISVILWLIFIIGIIQTQLFVKYNSIKPIDSERKVNPNLLWN